MLLDSDASPTPALAVLFVRVPRGLVVALDAEVARRTAGVPRTTWSRTQLVTRLLASSLGLDPPPLPVRRKGPAVGVPPPAPPRVQAQAPAAPGDPSAEPCALLVAGVHPTLCVLEVGHPGGCR